MLLQGIRHEAAAGETDGILLALAAQRLLVIISGVLEMMLMAVLALVSCWLPYYVS